MSKVMTDGLRVKINFELRILHKNILEKGTVNFCEKFVCAVKHM